MVSTECSQTVWTGDKVRQTFISFFEERGHSFVPSSSTIPHDDPTLLFTNAGMNQFKPIFQGTVDPNSEFSRLKRAANSQKCIRAGGKHNDLDDVGKDSYHHTFFEMLGNWSFGDYFKVDAINWAWELLTEVFGLDKDRLYVSYFGGDAEANLPADLETRDLWLAKGVAPERVLPFGMSENFWEMGDTGPCGPCSEIHYDRIGGRTVPELVNADDPDLLEIWNLVFMEFNREADRSLKRLPSQSVDTGMGLERLVSVLQDRRANYDTDLFSYLFEAIEKGTGARPYSGKYGKDDADGIDTAYRVLADHIRTLAFALSDGGVPDKDDRGYVLRRVLRRAIRFAHEKLGAKPGFFPNLITAVVDKMGHAFPELKKNPAGVIEILVEEEAQFRRTLDRGIRLFTQVVENPANTSAGTLSGEVAFKLYDTYGFPKDLTQIMAEERGLTVDLAGYAAAEAEAKARSQSTKSTAGAAVALDVHTIAELNQKAVPRTDDSFKYTHSEVEARVLAIFHGGAFVESFDANATHDLFGLILDQTNFYAEQGGQIFDTGLIHLTGGSEGVLEVENVQVYNGFVLHTVSMSTGVVRVGDAVSCAFDPARRRPIRRNHTATHLLNNALASVLGGEVNQQGSLVAPDRLRFDFSFGKAVPAEKLREVEALVREQIAADLPVYYDNVPLVDAEKIAGVKAMFGQSYPDPVRVLSVGTPIATLVADPASGSGVASVEFCGGTHVARSSDIQDFVLLSEEAVSRGVRRVVAVTGPEAVRAGELADQLQQAIADVVKNATGASLVGSLNGLDAQVTEAPLSLVRKQALRAQIAEAKRAQAEQDKLVRVAQEKAANQRAEELLAKLTPDDKFLVEVFDLGSNAKHLSQLSRQFPKVGVFFMSVDRDLGRVLHAANVPAALADTLSAKDWSAHVVDGALGGKSGGSKTTAQGAGPEVGAVEKACELATAFAKLKVSSE
ncbi:alanyl-tRNA synthetase [Fonticula alba]|uniref:Alanine--tRNA ligase n=1 Tax=Fonticula alba TaxID=691883 RepID=A0A058ZG24_FONAL|nr:alanyl-tRNA synthetase [Fonticula alba]KCV73345.1 alanyl-tRNA synthetase [Fonticula alba]|eukprot:XP_009493046.1 alanyl-tRNA synthetase [Fonticula alba]